MGWKFENYCGAFGKAVLVASGLFVSGGAISAAQDSAYEAGAVFAATNNVHRNEVIMYLRNGEGKLKNMGRFVTGGRGEGGTNDPLQSQSSLIVSADRQFLLAVNAGTSDISIFRISSYGLELMSVTPSGGGNPVSLALHDDLLYVVNFGGSYHTAGFRLQPSGALVPVKNSKQSLSGLDPGASTAAFTPDGAKLVVTERITNRIDVFTVNGDGSLSNPVYNKSEGVEPFGIQFTPSGVLLVTETNGGPPNLGSVSAYNIEAGNTLEVITSKANAWGEATCWITTSGAFAWVSNSASGSIGAFALNSSGALASLGVVAQQPALPNLLPPVSLPLDLTLTADNQYVYVFFSNLGKIVGYKVGDSGHLTEVTSAWAEKPGVGAEGLAAY